MHTHIAAVTLFTLCVSSTPAPFQERQARTSQGFVLEAGEHHLRDILERAAKFLGRNFILPLPELASDQHTIQIQKSMNLDVIGCEEIVSQLAYAKEFAIVPLDAGRGLYEVIYMRGGKRPEVATRAIQMTPDEVLRKSRLKMYVLTAVPLKYIDATRAGQQLRPFFAAAGAGGSGLQFGNAGAPHHLLLSGFADQVAAAIRLLRLVDKGDGDRVPSAMIARVAYMSNKTLAQGKSVHALQSRVGNLEAQVASLMKALNQKNSK